MRIPKGCLVAGGITVLLIVALLLVLDLAFTFGHRQWERTRRVRFEDHKEIYERLVRMSNEDFQRNRLTRIAFDFTRLDNNSAWPRPKELWGLSEQRWREYRRLFKAADLPVGLDRQGGSNENIFFPTWGVGMSGEGTEEGFVWSPKPLSPIHSKGNTFEVKPLGGNWYLYFSEIT